MRRIANPVYPQNWVARVRIPLSPFARAAGLGSAFLLPLLFGSCASRSITIESEPAGAEVILDRRPVGRTPVTVEHRYGGVHEIILLLPKHRPTVLFHDSERFLLDYPPLDAFADLFGTQDHQRVVVQLEPSRAMEEFAADKEAVLQALRERAETLRSRSRGAFLDAPPREPLLPPPGGN